MTSRIFFLVNEAVELGETRIFLYNNIFLNNDTCTCLKRTPKISSLVQLQCSIQRRLWWHPFHNILFEHVYDNAKNSAFAVILNWHEKPRLLGVKVHLCVSLKVLRKRIEEKLGKNIILGSRGKRSRTPQLKRGRGICPTCSDPWGAPPLAKLHGTG